ncbi:MAG: hypothetical protein MR411_00560 [Tenericutes bacterium]|nr:hypothetical protein [Mycoplasmatota bacterium]
MRKNVIAILIGLISIIPYIITYVFFNYSISIYLFLIPYFIYQIYKPNTKHEYLNIFLISSFCIFISMFLIIPSLIILKEKYLFSIKTFSSLYKLSIIKNFLISYAFLLISNYIFYRKKYETNIIILISIFILFITGFIIKFNNKLDYINYKTIKINDNHTIKLPSNFKRISNNIYTVDDIKKGSLDYNNSLIKFITIKYLNNYTLIKKDDISKKDIKQYKIKKIKEYDNSIVIIGKKGNGYIYYDYYIKDNENIIYIQFILDHEDNITKKIIDTIK